MKMTQRDRVLRHLKELGNITSWQAFKEYGITRLSAIIFDLRQDGYEISSFIESHTNRYDEKTHYARYVLKTKEQSDQPKNFEKFEKFCDFLCNEKICVVE